MSRKNGKVLGVKPILDDTGMYHLVCSQCGVCEEGIEPGLEDQMIDIHFEAHRGPAPVLHIPRTCLLPRVKDLTPRSRVMSITSREKEDRKGFRQNTYPWYPDFSGAVLYH